jgi:FkbM family methyltransferase
MGSNTASHRPIVSALDQWLLNAIARTPTEGLANRIRWRVLLRLRRLRLRFSDPEVEFRLCGKTLRLPLSHELPVYKRSLPQYSLNLGRIASDVAHKYADLTMIDIGANVGDSASIVRASCGIPILCIEGEQRFFRYLAANAEALGDVELEPAFMGARGDKAVGVEIQRGTARVVLGSESIPQMPMRTLSEVLQSHPRFSNAKLWKIDAEGFDCKIIACESKLIARVRPVIFFEYQPLLSQQAGYESFRVFSNLVSMGYRTLMVYEAVGHYLLSFDVREVELLEDIHHYYGTTLGGYCDLVAFHAEDTDIAEAARAGELRTGQLGRLK